MHLAQALLDAARLQMQLLSCFKLLLHLLLLLLLQLGRVMLMHGCHVELGGSWLQPIENLLLRLLSRVGP